MSEPETALEQGWLLAEMESRLGCSIEELARRFDRSPTWVASRLALVETLPETVQQQVREGKIPAQLAMRYLVPVARISLEHCQRMAAAFAEPPWTTRQAGELYQAWRAASGVVRERILAAPKLFRKDASAAQHARKGTEPDHRYRATSAGASGISSAPPRGSKAQDPTRHRTADRTPTTNRGGRNESC